MRSNYIKHSKAQQEDDIFPTCQGQPRKRIVREARHTTVQQVDEHSETQEADAPVSCLPKDEDTQGMAWGSKLRLWPVKATNTRVDNIM